MAASSSQQWKKVDVKLPSGSADASTPSHYYVWPTEIEQSQQDDRSYRLIKLENGMQALLVHDAQADKSAASLDVAVGHLSDPDDMPGLAHFCEHLLFMGTEQFPRENDYAEYINSNGGSTNAYTSTTNTNYYFNVSSSALLGAIPRFAGFFHSPLFTPSCTNRELNAVDSEHKKNLQADSWRLFQLGKSLAKPGHVWGKFGSGNRESLTEVGRKLRHKQTPADNAATPTSTHLAPSPIPSRLGSPAPSDVSESEADGGFAGRETRRRLVEWWEKSYCASRMKLVILGKESLDELTDQAVKHFSPVLNRGLDPLVIFPDAPWGPEERGTLVFAKTVMDFRALEICIPTPWQAPNYTTKPASFIGHFIGHEGPGSVYSYLKNRGWVASLSAGPSNAARGFGFFKVTVVMTKEGLDNYQQIIEAIFSYFSLLRSSEFPVYHHDETRIQYETRFRFKEKSSPASYVSSLAEKLQDPYPRDRVVTGPSLIWDWNEGLVRELLAGLTAENSRVTVMAKDLDALAPKGDWLKEKWYATEYKQTRVPEEWIQKAQQANQINDLFLPGPNAFMPNDLSVAKKVVDQPLKRPFKVRETSMSTLWHKKDDQFWVPKGTFMMELTSPFASTTPANAVKTRLFADLVIDSLSEYAYDADLAGLRYSITAHSTGMSVALSGYNDKLHILLQTVLEKMKSLEVKEDRLKVMQDQLRLEYENFPLSQPYEISDYLTRYLLMQNIWKPEEKLSEIDGVTVEDMHLHIKTLLARVHFKALVHGNFLKDDSVRMVSLAEKILDARPLLPTEYTGERSLILPPGKNYVLEDVVPNKKDVNSSASYYVHVGDIMDRELRAVCALLCQMIHEPAFNVLRTQEQLGYIVSSGMWQSTASMGLRIVVQSERKPDYIESRIEAFLDHFKGVLEAMTDEEFDQHRNGFIEKQLAKLKNAGEEASRFWTHVENGYLEFTRRDINASNLRKVTKADVVQFYNQYIHPESSTRRKLAVHLRSEAPSKSNPIKFSVAAAEALLPQLQARSVPVMVEQYHQQSALEPAVEDVKNFWSGYLGSLPNLTEGVKEEILELVDKFSRTYPAEGDPVANIGEVKLKEDTIFIKNIAAFKASLTISNAATPVEDYQDMSTAKL